MSFPAPETSQKHFEVLRLRRKTSSAANAEISMFLVQEEPL